MEIVALLIDAIVQVASAHALGLLCLWRHLAVFDDLVATTGDLGDDSHYVLENGIYGTGHRVELDEGFVGIQFALDLYKVKCDGAGEKDGRQSEVFRHREGM